MSELVIKFFNGFFWPNTEFEEWIAWDKKKEDAIIHINGKGYSNRYIEVWYLRTREALVLLRCARFTTDWTF